MASNPTPDDDDVLLALAEDMADGCHLHEVDIGIKQNTEAVMRAAITVATAGIAGLAAARLAVVQKTEDRRTMDAAGSSTRTGTSRAGRASPHPSPTAWTSASPC